MSVPAVIDSIGGKARDIERWLLRLIVCGDNRVRLRHGVAEPVHQQDGSGAPARPCRRFPATGSSFRRDQRERKLSGSLMVHSRSSTDRGGPSPPDQRDRVCA